MSDRLRILAIVLVSLGWVARGEAQESAEPASKPEAQALTIADPDIGLEQLKVLVKPLTKSELEVEASAWFELLQLKARQIAATRLGVMKTQQALKAEDEGAAAESLKAAQTVSRAAEAAAEEGEQALTDTAKQALGVDPASPEESENIDPQEGNSPSPNADASTAAEVTESAELMKDELLGDVTELQDQRTAIGDRLAVVLDSLESKGGDVQEYRQYLTAVSGVELDTSDVSSAWAGIMGWISSKEGGQRWLWNLGEFLAILLVTYIVARMVAAIVNWLLERKVQLSQLAERLLRSTITNLIMLIGCAIALTALEVDITPILAAIGATGLVVGLALQGTLSNFASGLMILINRPFDVGDVVSAGGVTGTVNQMNLVSTTFRTFDNQTIHVPNNEIWNNVITNVTANETRRVDMEFGIGYDDDFEQAEKIIQSVVQAHALVLEDPTPVVVTHALADSSVNIVCRPWAKTGDWWTVKTDITREVKRRFDQAGISIPYPQQDIHVYSHGGKSMYSDTDIATTTK